MERGFYHMLAMPSMRKLHYILLPNLKGQTTDSSDGHLQMTMSERMGKVRTYPIAEKGGWANWPPGNASPLIHAATSALIRSKPYATAHSPSTSSASF